MANNDEMRELIDKLNEYTKYYDMGKPRIADWEWDKLYIELQEMERKDHTIFSDSPTQSISYEVQTGLVPVDHEKDNPMLSLAKTKDWNEVKRWSGKREVIASLKLDGLSCRLTYDHGKLVRAETRGNGITGNIVTPAALTFTNIPIEIPQLQPLIVDGEAIITYDVFEEFADEYVNPRNLAAGSLSLLDTAEVAKRKIKFVAWHLVNSDKKTYLEDMGKLHLLGFTTVPTRIIDPKDDDFSEKMRNLATGLSYPIDGLVIRYNDNEFGRSLGRTNHHWNHSVAFKYEEEQFLTKLQDIVYDVSKTGLLTPVAIFDPIDTGDSVITRATLHNLSMLEKLSRGKEFKGDTLTVVKANGIIPRVIAWYHPKETGEQIPIPDYCPVCGARTIIHQTSSTTKTLLCGNPNCEGKMSAKIVQFFDKRGGIDGKGFSDKTVDFLLEEGYVGSIKDMFRLSYHAKEWSKQPGWGPGAVKKVIKAIDDAAKNATLEQYINAIGIPMVGPSMAKQLADRFKTWKGFRTASLKELEEIPRLGLITIPRIMTFDYSEFDEIVEKYMPHLNVGQEEREFLNDVEFENLLDGKSFCITGKLAIYKNRKELEHVIQDCGGVVKATVTQKLDYLISNDPDSKTSKHNKAIEFGVQIITEQDFVNMIS